MRDAFRYSVVRHKDLIRRQSRQSRGSRDRRLSMTMKDRRFRSEGSIAMTITNSSSLGHDSKTISAAQSATSTTSTLLRSRIQMALDISSTQGTSMSIAIFSQIRRLKISSGTNNEPGPAGKLQITLSDTRGIFLYGARSSICCCAKAQFGLNLDRWDTAFVICRIWHSLEHVGMNPRCNVGAK